MFDTDTVVIDCECDPSETVYSCELPKQYLAY